MRADRLRRVVIVGGGTAGWMAAAALSRVMGGASGLSFELVESDEIGTVGVGESTIPQIVLFNALLGLDEGDFLRATDATYKMGIEFRDWTHLGDRFVHPFGTYGLDMQGVAFHHHWLKARALGDTTPLEQYSLNAMTAYRGRFGHPRPDLAQSPMSTLAYAFHFDAALYVRLLRRLAEGWGVTRSEGRVVDVEQDGETGHVDAVVLADGRRVAGDLFLDCSGFRALLIEERLRAGFEDWSGLLPCDRAWAVPCAFGPAATRLPLTRATARTAGWQWRIPLQQRLGNGYVYSSAHLSDDEAAGVLLANLDGAPLADPRPLRFTAGHRRRAWIGNVVALGLAGGFLEPLESTSIHLVQTAIARLLTLFPTRAFSPLETQRFNDEMAREYRDIRDFLALHYTAGARDDSAFWRDMRARVMPDGTAYKLAMFRENGRILRDHHEVFAEASWLSVMSGKGVRPNGYHPAADTLPDDETLARLAAIRDVIADTAQDLPRQDEYLRQLGCTLAPVGAAA
ncbi:tryptophan halogenase family protein [Sphingomonas sp. XXL09]|uniref:tryptophan halogenase family protein n=1 Tax=Sphingomonas sp. XXL09 TaxID=3457787 RepID=UPI00406BD705